MYRAGRKDFIIAIIAKTKRLMYTQRYAAKSYENDSNIVICAHWKPGGFNKTAESSTLCLHLSGQTIFPSTGTMHALELVHCGCTAASLSRGICKSIAIDIKSCLSGPKVLKWLKPCALALQITTTGGMPCNVVLLGTSASFLGKVMSSTYVSCHVRSGRRPKEFPISSILSSICILFSLMHSAAFLWTTQACTEYIVSTNLPDNCSIRAHREKYQFVMNTLFQVWRTEGFNGMFVYRDLPNDLIKVTADIKRK